MFRQPLLPRACVIVAVGFSVLFPVAPSWCQDRSTDERLDRLERDLNMLQRQVYRGGPPPAMGGDAGSAVDVEVRMERLEQQMRELTGRFEEVVNQTGQLRRRLEQVNGDLRVGQTGGGPGPDASAGPPGGPYPGPPPRRPEFAGPPSGALPFPPGPAGDPNDEPTPPGVAAMAPEREPPPGESAGGPTPIFGTLTPPGTGPPSRALAGVANAGPPPVAGALPSGSAIEQYNYAFGLLKKADYPGAETALKAFVERHPTNPMAGSAQYWLGETYYTRNRYAEAASAFAEGYKRYPKSPKAADDLLKLAMSLARANQKQNACLALAQLDHDFPSGTGAVREHAAAEKKRLGC